MNLPPWGLSSTTPSRGSHIFRGESAMNCPSWGLPSSTLSRGSHTFCGESEADSCYHAAPVHRTRLGKTLESGLSWVCRGVWHDFASTVGTPVVLYGVFCPACGMSSRHGCLLDQSGAGSAGKCPQVLRFPSNLWAICPSLGFLVA